MVTEFIIIGIILLFVGVLWWFMSYMVFMREDMFSKLFKPSEFKLPFKIPYKYKMGGLEHNFSTIAQTRRLIIYGKITTWYGKLLVDVKDDGLWGYRNFILTGIGMKDGFNLKPCTDVLDFLAEGRTFSRIFLEHGIVLEYDAALGSKIRDIESKINNLKVMERRHREKYGPEEKGENYGDNDTENSSNT